MRVIYLFSILLIISSCIDTGISKESDKEKSSIQIEYKKMLNNQRKSHQTAINRIFNLNDYSKKMDMISILSKKIFEMLSTNLVNLQKATDEKSKSNQELASFALNVIENTAFVADLALHFPKIFHRVYDKKTNWKNILESSIELTKKSGIVDEETLQLINLMQQELELIPKDPNYVNPYNQKRKEVDDQKPQPTKKKREKKKRGPGLSGGRNEL